MISEKAIYSILIILIVGFIFNNWEKDQKDKQQVQGYDLVQKFFLGDKSLAKMNIKKPIIWVHIPYDINARKWESFFSSSDTQPEKARVANTKSRKMIFNRNIRDLRGKF